MSSVRDVSVCERRAVRAERVETWDWVLEARVERAGVGVAVVEGRVVLR